MILIGDCHGLTSQYEEIIKYLEGDGIQSILLGELGFHNQHLWFLNSPLSKQNKVLFGNHDFFPWIDKPYSLGRFKHLPEHNMFAMAGAFSIDQQHRVEGRDWFREEEMNVAEERDCLKAYLKAKPEIVITHDAPMFVVDKMFNYSYKYPNGQRTNMYFQNLFYQHQPKVWVFAHHHKGKDMIIEKTHFICLDELQTLKI